MEYHVTVTNILFLFFEFDENWFVSVMFWFKRIKCNIYYGGQVKEKLFSI